MLQAKLIGGEGHGRGYLRARAEISASEGGDIPERERRYPRTRLFVVTLSFVGQERGLHVVLAGQIPRVALVIVGVSLVGEAQVIGRVDGAFAQVGVGLFLCIPAGAFDGDGGIGGVGIVQGVGGAVVLEICIPAQDLAGQEAVGVVVGAAVLQVVAQVAWVSTPVLSAGSEL